MAALGLPLLNCVEKVSGHDPQFRHLGDLPFALRVFPADALAGIGIAHHLHAVPDDFPLVHRILQDAVVPALVAVDGAGIPFRATRGENALIVELLGNIARRHPAEVHAEDTAHHLGLLFVDRALAGPAEDEIIAVGDAAGCSTIGNDAGHAPPHLVLEVGEEHRPEQPPDADLHGIGNAFVHGDDLDASEGKALEDAGKVFLISGDAIERLDDHNVKIATAGVGHELHDAVAADERGAGLRAVGIDPAWRHSVPGGVFPA
ncbi:hypothetical protein shn_14845 [Shinella sp. HZN7]|nr:hypothetical protein shn_14845 [Shinella sp. HZN7]